VRERFIDGRYDDRRTAGSVVAALFPASNSAGRSVEAPHIAITLAQSDRDVVPGSRFTLSVELALPPGFHVYAPEARGYKPVELALEPLKGCELSPVRYPPSKTLRVAELGGEIPVYEGRVSLRADVHLAASDLIRKLQNDPDHPLTITLSGVLRYQACDAKECFPPCEVSVSWDVAVHPLDFERTDPELRKPVK
jgi:hypothetical protein